MLQRIIDNDRELNLRNSRYNPNKNSLKRRTYRVKDSIVIDHVSGKKISLRDILRGRIELIQ